MADPNTMTDPELRSEYDALSHDTYVIEGWLFAFLLFGILLLAWSQGWGFWQLPVLIALGLFALGVFGGFLFGIPKVAARQNNTGTERLQHLLDPNTNLEQISDWLTKIIVGLGLVNLKRIWPALLLFAKDISPGFHAWANVTPLAAALYFPVLGFGSGFLFTRIYLSGLINRADMQLAFQRRTAQFKNALNSVQAALIGTAKEGPSKPLPANLPLEQANALRITDTLLRRKPESKYSSKDWMDRAYAAYAEQRLTLAANYFGEAARAPGAATEQIAKAYLNQGISYDQLNLKEEAIRCYDAVISRFETISDPTINIFVASAMYSKGQALNSLERFKGSLQAYDDLIARFEGDVDPKIRELVTSGILNKGVAFVKLGDMNDALVAFDHLIARLGETADPKEQMRLVTALGDKGEILAKTGSDNKALQVLNAALDRFKGATDQKVKNRLVHLQFTRAVILQKINRRQAIPSMEALISEQSQNPDPTVRTIVAKAREYLSTPEGDWKFIDITWH